MKNQFFPPCPGCQHAAYRRDKSGELCLRSFLTQSRKLNLTWELRVKSDFMFRLAEALLLFRYCQILRLAILRASYTTRRPRLRTLESHEKTETEEESQDTKTRRLNSDTKMKIQNIHISRGQDTGWWNSQSENFHFETYRIYSCPDRNSIPLISCTVRKSWIVACILWIHCLFSFSCSKFFCW